MWVGKGCTWEEVLLPESLVQWERALQGAMRSILW